MPYKPKKPCSYPGCPRLSIGRFCEEHAKLDARNYELYKRDPAARKRYGSSWRKIRSEFLSEHPYCELCKQEGKHTLAVLVHHIKPAKEGGGNDENNLMALCQTCHSRLHSKRGDRWQNR